eukprot:7069275-Pyramimonas_sp.AAC.1
MAGGTNEPAAISPRFLHYAVLFFIRESGSSGFNYVSINENPRPDGIRRESNFPCRPLLRQDQGPQHLRFLVYAYPANR